MPRAALPEDWLAFTRYYERTLESNVIRAGFPARDIASFLFRAPQPGYRPVFGWLRVMTAGLLPDRVRTEFGLTFGSVERAIFRGSVAALRVRTPRCPRICGSCRRTSTRSAGSTGSRGATASGNS